MRLDAGLKPPLEKWIALYYFLQSSGKTSRLFSCNEFTLQCHFVSYKVRKDLWDVIYNSPRASNQQR